MNLFHLAAVGLLVVLVYLTAYVHGLREGTRVAVYREGGNYGEWNPGKFSQVLRSIFCGHLYTPDAATTRAKRVHEIRASADT